MNKMYAQRNGVPVDSTKQNTTAVRLANKIIERERISRERSSQIVDYYTNGKMKDLR